MTELCIDEQIKEESEKPPSPWQDVTWEDWNDWHWQLANRIRTIEELKQVVTLSEDELDVLSHSLNTLRMAITPYYASLMDASDPHCPIRLRAIPSRIGDAYLLKKTWRIHFLKMWIPQ